MGRKGGERTKRAKGRKDKGWGMTYLTGSVDDVALVFGALVVDALGEGAFYGRVIGFDKVVVDEFDDQG